MSFQLLITGETFRPDSLKFLEEQGYRVEFHPELLPEETLMRLLHNKDAYILGGLEYASAAVIHKAPHLKVIAVMGVGYRRFVDIEAATQCGIVVTNTPGTNSRAVAEMTIALMLSMRRKIPFLTTLTKTGNWRNNIVTQELSSQTLGIIGMGNIGSLVTDIARNGLRMKILYTNPTPRTEIEKQTGAKQVSLEELLRSSDVVSLHCPLTRNTRNLLAEKQLDRMKNNAILINTARPQIVNPNALYTALQHESIAGCAMDGYYLEPAPWPEDDPYGLLHLSDERFLVTSHLAYLTEDSIQRMCDLAAKSVINVLEGYEWPYIVNPDYTNNTTLLQFS